MHHDDFDDDLSARFAELPRTASMDAAAREGTIDQLRREGFFERRERGLRWGLIAAAAVGVFAAGAFAGARYTRRNSLEEQLGRRNLTVAERVLLLQRAGSAYVQAAQGYADATTHVDSNAVEVASRVLLGAAHAVARSSLDAGLSERLSTALTPVVNKKPVIWF